jgi:hypothetical protein
MKKTLTFLSLMILSIFAFSMSVFAENNLSTKDFTAIRELMDYRPELTSENPETALTKIANYRENLFSEENKKNLSEQGSLILETFLILEEFNYLYEINPKHPNIESIVMPQNQILEKWIKSHKEEEISSWLYVTAGDLLSCSMSLYSIPKAMEIGLLVKNYYEIALEKNPNMCYGNLNMAQWFFHAPAIGGGSKKKAKELFQVALKNASGKGETFYTNLLYSQFLLDQNDKKNASAYLSKAESIQPDSKKIVFVKKLNDNGFTLFYYMLNTEKVEKKLGL